MFLLQKHNTYNMSRIVVVLDLDKTLIYNEDEQEKYDFIVDETYRIRVRPYLKEFLEECEKHFDIAFWTSGTDEYATEIIKNIYSLQKAKFVYHRDHCTLETIPIRKRDGRTYHLTYAIKDINKIIVNECYYPNKIIVVDDKPVSYMNNEQNAILVAPWEGKNEKDAELLLLKDYLLKHVKDLSDVTKACHIEWKQKIKSSSSL